MHVNFFLKPTTSTTTITRARKVTDFRWQDIQMHTYTPKAHTVRLAWNGKYYNATLNQPAPMFRSTDIFL